MKDLEIISTGLWHTEEIVIFIVLMAGLPQKIGHGITLKIQLNKIGLNILIIYLTVCWESYLNRIVFSIQKNHHIMKNYAQIILNYVRLLKYKVSPYAPS